MKSFACLSGFVVLNFESTWPALWVLHLESFS